MGILKFKHKRGEYYGEGNLGDNETKNGTSC